MAAAVLTGAAAATAAESVDSAGAEAESSKAQAAVEVEAPPLSSAERKLLEEALNQQLNGPLL